MTTQEELAKAYRKVFNPEDDAGRLVLRDLAVRCSAYETTLDTGDVHQMCANEGRRQVWLIIQELAGLDLSLLMKFRQENLIDLGQEDYD